MKVFLDLNNLDSYRLFLKIKSLPRYSFSGRMADVPDEYADRLGLEPERNWKAKAYRPSDYLFDYARDISKLAINKQKFAVFLECGLGKTSIMQEFAKHAQSCRYRRSVMSKRVKEEAAKRYQGYLGLVKVPQRFGPMTKKQAKVVMTNTSLPLFDDIPAG